MSILASQMTNTINRYFIDTCNMTRLAYLINMLYTDYHFLNTVWLPQSIRDF